VVGVVGVWCVYVKSQYEVSTNTHHTFAMPSTRRLEGVSGFGQAG